MTGPAPLNDVTPPSLPGSRWQVQLLGGLHLRCGDVLVSRFPDRPTLLLFARLALQPQVLHGRDTLAQALWPEILDADGRRERADASAVRRERLRKTLSKLAGVFRTGGTQHVEPFHADRETVGLNADAFDIDVHRFDRHCQRRQHDAARACYGGELLPGLGDDWIARERARLAAARSGIDEAGHGDADDDPEADDDLGKAPAGSLTVPPPRQHFFGREAELDSVRRGLLAHRLVVLTGPGGCGKTTLASEAARRPQGFGVVALVWLEDCTAPDGIVDRLRVALDLRRDGGDPLQQIAAHLAGRRTLLMLDNFEQLVGAAGNAELDRLLQALPDASLLLTTRRQLQRSDAHCVELSPLPLPDPGAALATALRNPGVALFVAAAKAARADFSLNQRNLAGVIEVCRLLDGLPLSIRLAAARIRSFAPHELAVALARSAGLLARAQTRAGQDSRHASLTMALDWSWRLLDDAAHSALRSLATFRGGWTAEQARSLLAGQPVDALLAALARDSLLQPLDAEGGPPRLGLLGVLREFVIEQCSPEQLRELRQQHRELFLAAAGRRAGGNEWLAEADDANCVEALETAWADGDEATALSLAVALAEPWRSRGASARAIELLQDLARCEHLPPAPRVQLLTLLATLRVNVGQGRQAHVEVAQALALAGADPALRAQALLTESDVLFRADRSPQGMARAQALLEQAEASLAGLQTQTTASTRLQGRLLLIQGRMALMHLHQVQAAAELFERAERRFSVLGDRRSAVLALPGRTACLLEQKHYREVIAVAGKGEREATALGDTVTRLQLLDRLSVAHDAIDEAEQALRASQRQTRLAGRHGLLYYAAFGVWNQCGPLARLGQHELAAQLLAFVCRHWYADTGELDSDDKAYVAEVRKQVRARLGPTRLRAAWARGQALSLHEALALAGGQAGE